MDELQNISAECLTDCAAPPKLAALSKDEFHSNKPTLFSFWTKNLPLANNFSHRLLLKTLCREISAQKSVHYVDFYQQEST